MLTHCGLILFTLCLSAHSNTDSSVQPVIPQIDGVRIGDQIWSATNLDVATFRNGDPIPEAKTDEEWVKAGREGRPAWCYYKTIREKERCTGACTTGTR